MIGRRLSAAFQLSRRSQAGFRKVCDTFRSWLERRDSLILDTETTGLGPEGEIIEIAVISTGRIRTGAAVRMASTLSIPRSRS